LKEEGEGDNLWFCGEHQLGEEEEERVDCVRRRGVEGSVNWVET
jgi:hypothetical protein